VENIMSSKLFTTRQGTVLLGVIAAVIAAIALLVYLNQYRDSVNKGSQFIQVITAKQLIQKGTPGNVIGTTGVYEKTSFPKNQLKTGAILDPSTLAGKVALVDIYPGQQLTASEFGVAKAGTLTSYIARNQRAVVIPLGTPQQAGGQISLGSHVDVWASVGKGERLVFQNMYVLDASGGNVTLRTDPLQAGVLIFLSQNSKIWLVLRPTVGSIVSNAPAVGQANANGH
jgi:Flp pilus assembly protein CpaB